METMQTVPKNWESSQLLKRYQGKKQNYINTFGKSKELEGKDSMFYSKKLQRVWG